MRHSASLFLCKLPSSLMVVAHPLSGGLHNCETISYFNGDPLVPAVILLTLDHCVSSALTVVVNLDRFSE